MIKELPLIFFPDRSAFHNWLIVNYDSEGIWGYLGISDVNPNILFDRIL